MAITVEGIHDLAHWARSKACNSWRTDGVCLEKETATPLADPHDGCIQAQRAHDLLASIQRFDGDDVVGWLASDDAVDLDLW